MKKNKKNQVSKENLKRARSIAFALEKSFSSPAPAEAMAPAPLLEEILELGDAGLKGMLEHLNFTSEDGFLSSLLAIKALNNSEIIPSLLDLALSFKWTPAQLKALRDTILSIDSDSIIPDFLIEKNLEEISKNIDLLLNNKELDEGERSILQESIEKLSVDSQSLIFCQILKKGETSSVVKLFRLFENIFEKTQIFSPDLINLVVSLGNAEAAIFLVNMNKKSLNRKFKSLLRKSIFRLEKKGVFVEMKTPKNESLFSNNYQEEDIAKAICSSTDGTGRKILWIIRSKNPKGRYLAEFNLKTESGIEDLSLVETTSKEIRNFVSKIEEQDILITSEIPVSYAFWLLERAQSENEKLGITPPSGFTRARMLLSMDTWESKSSDFFIHPITNMIDIFSGDDERIHADILLKNKAFKSWFVDDQLIRPFLKPFIDSLNTNKENDKQKNNVDLEKIITNTANEIFENKDYVRKLISQLEENAYLYKLSDIKDFDRECFTLSKEMNSHESPPSFFIEMVRSTFIAWSKSLNEQKENRKEE